MRRCRTSCSNRFRSHTTASSFKLSMRYSSRTHIYSIKNCRRWSSYRKKIYKRCFLVYLRRWMKDNAILPPEQSGFREPHSTTTRFVQFPQHISTGLLQQTASLVIYVDFTKAFDQLWHDGLLYKLHRMNCPHELVIFIIEYLKNRKCYIETQKHMCRTDSIPSLSLWNSSTDSFSHPLSSVRRWPCTDHACLSMVASNWIRTLNGTNRPASIESSPSLRHRVETADQLSQDRVAMDTSTSSHSNPLTLLIGQYLIKRTDVYKYLGYHVDERLSFSEHCTRMLQKVQKNSALLSSNTSLGRKRHQWKGEILSIRPSFNLIRKWST